MSSCVRYSVAVYVGLMIAGALAGPQPDPTKAGLVETWVDPTDFRIAQPTGAWHQRGKEIKVQVQINDRKLPSWVND